MATTTNFGWETPDDTDFVKDGAAAIRTLGSSIDTSLVDLKGGTTGQVLSKTSATDMDFTWVTTDDANAIQNAIVDAKGDLIAASAADTPARLAVGANGQVLIADSSTSTGLRYQSSYDGNAIINGGMDIWQRGTNFTATSVYTADRWFRDAQTYSTISQQTTSDTTNLPTIFYSARIARNVGQTGTASIGIISSLESLDSYRFAGQTVTLSFYARAGANFSATSNIAVADIYTGTGTNQRRDFSTAFTGEATALSGNATLTTTWQRFSFTATIAATATEIAVRVRYSPTGTAGANDWMEVTGVQLELGSVATTFKRSNGAGGTIQGELAACQRYYYRFTPTANGQKYAVGSCETTTAAELVIPFPVSMRTNPTALEQSGTATDYSIRAAATTTTCNLVPAFLTGTTSNSSIYFYVASGLVAGQTALGRVANTNGYLGWSAEL